MRTLFESEAISGGSAPLSPGPQVLTVEDGIATLPGRDVLLQSMYSRSGPDLVLTSPEDGTFIIKGFFLSDQPPSLTDGEGAYIGGELASQFAGAMAPGQYAGQTGGLGVPIGQVRATTGAVQAIRADGTTVTLNVGDPVYLDDILETGAGATIGLVLVDGTTLALGENGELVLDELVYDPSTQGGKATLSLISGAAEFVSGTIAKSGQDAMTFKMPVGTIGIRGTRVFAAFDPQSGEVTILNRPTGVDGAGQETAGTIFLSLPDGTPIGAISSGNGGWQWNPTQGQAPQAVQLTEAQIQNIVAAVANTVNTVAAQPPMAPPTAPIGGPAPGGAPGGPGGDQQGQGTDQGPGQGQEGGQQQTPAPDGQQQGQNLGPVGPPPTPTQTVQVTPPPTPTATGTPPTVTPGTPPPTAPVTPPPAVVPPLPPPVVPAEISVAGGGAVSDLAAGTVTFTITRGGNLTSSVTINFATQDGSAVGGTDYAPVSGSVTFAAGETSKTVEVPILVSGRSESAEGFSLVISSAGSGAIITGGGAEATINADPPLPTLSIGSIEVTDTVAGTATLTVTRSGNISTPSTVGYSTQGGSAVAGSDFTSTSGTVTFAANQATATIVIPILSVPLTAATLEGAETFTVVLSDPVDAVIAQGTGTVTITADAPLPTLSVGSVEISDLQAGTATLTVTRSGNLNLTTTANFSTQGGSATAGSDFSAVSGTVTFAVGQATATIAVPILANTTPLTTANREGAETFSVVISNAVGGTITNGTGTVTITADPALPTLSIGSVEVSDAQSGTAVITVTRSGNLSFASSVDFSTQSGSATAGGDFNAASGTLTFAAGQSSATISIGINGNPSPLTSANREESESFSVVLSNAQGAEISSGTGTVTISADPVIGDALFSIAGVSASEGGNAVLTVTRGGDLSSEVSVGYATSNITATAGSDFTAASGTLTFAAGQTSATITIPITSDGSPESAETFAVVLSNPTGGAISSGTATVTIAAQTSGDEPVFIGVFGDSPYAQFDGSDLMSTTGTLALGSHTVEAWVRVGGDTGSPQSITAINGSGDISYFYYDNGMLIARLVHGSDDKEVESSVTIAEGEWTHVAYTYDDTTGDLKLYINGAEDTGATVNANDTFNFLSAGHFFVGSGGPPGFLGALDQVRVWNTARSGAEIADNIHTTQPGSETGLEIQYTFEAYDGTTAVNTASTGSSYDGNATGTFSSPKGGDYTLEFGGSTHLNTGITQSPNSFTLQASVRLYPGDTSTRPIFSKPTVSGGDDETFEFQVFIDPSNQLVLRMGNGESEGYEEFVGDHLQPGLSYNISVTYNGNSGDVGLYINSELYVDGSASLDNYNIYARQNGNLPIEIGRHDSSSPEYFSGYITDVRIWDLYLTESQVENSHNMQVPLGVNGLVAAYPFGNGVGNIVSDVSGNGFAAQVYGPTAWVPDGAPVLIDIPTTVTISEDTSIAGQIVASDPNDLTLSYSVSSGPAHGSLYTETTGFFRYAPNTNYVGTDSFTLQVENTNGDITTQVVNISVTAINDRPNMDPSATLPSIIQDDFDSAGATINSLFGSSFEDADGTFVGVAILNDTSNTGSQGHWEYSTNGTNWHDVDQSSIQTVGGGLLISKDTYIRFVPESGYTGSPGGLVVRPVDQVYVNAGGGWSVATASETRVTLQDALNNSRPVVFGVAPSLILITVGGAPPAEWDGPSSGSWTTASNWNPDVVPSIAAHVSIDGAYTVLLNNGATSGAKSLFLDGTATLTLDDDGSNPSSLSVDQNVLVANATLNIYGGSDAYFTLDLTVEADGAVNIGDATAGHSVQVLENVYNEGVISLWEGSLQANDLENSGEYKVMGTADTSLIGDFTNLSTGIVGVYGNGANVIGTFSDYSNFSNYGIFAITNLGGTPVDVTANMTGSAQFHNMPGGIVRFGLGAGAGHRTLDMNNSLTNHAASSPAPAGLIDVQYSATINGYVQNGGVLNVESGQTLTIHGGELSMTYAGNQGTFTGAGGIYFDDGGFSNDAYFVTYNGFTLGALQNLTFGNFSGNNNSRWMATGTTTINGNVTINNAILEGNSAKWILDGNLTVLGGFEPYDLSQTNTSNIHSRLSLTGEVDVAQDALTITSNGTLDIVGGGLGDPDPGMPDDDETAMAELNNDVVNNGVITMSSTGADVFLLCYAGNYSGADTEHPNNNRFYNFGTIDIQSGSGARYLQATDLRNEGMLLVKKDTLFYGKLFNIDTFTLYGGATFKAEANSDIYIKAGSTLGYSGGGVATIHIAGGQSSNFDESYIHFEESFALTSDFKIILGETGTPYNFTSGYNMETGQATIVTGEFLVRNGSINSDLDIQSGGQFNVENGYGGGQAGDVIVRSGATVRVEEVTEFSFANQVDLYSGSSLQIEDSASGADTRLGLYGDVNNEGGVTMLATGGSTNNAILQIGGTFTNMDGATLNIGAQRIEMYSGTATLRNDPGGAIIMTSGGVIDMYEGNLEINLDTGVPFTLVAGARIIVGSTTPSGVSTLSGLTNLGADATTIDVEGIIDIDNAEVDVVLEIESGGLLRNTDGEAVVNEDITVQAGGDFVIKSTAGAGTDVTMAANVFNYGDVLFDATAGIALLSFAATKYISNQASGIITFSTGTSPTVGGKITGGVDNFGDIIVDEGNAFFDIGASDFFNDVGASLTVGAAGSIDLTGTGVFNNDGFFEIFDNGNTTTTVEVDVVNTGTILLRDASDTGGTTGDTHLNIQGAVTNSGTIRLEVTGGSHAANIDFSGGYLNNNSGGNFTIEAGNGAGAHTITGDINNNSGGQIDVARSATFNLGGSTYFDNSSGATVAITGTNQTTTVTGSGTSELSNAGIISIAATNTLKISGTSKFVHHSGAALTGSGAVVIDDGASFRLVANLSTGVNIALGTASGLGAAWTNSSAYTATLSGVLTLNKATVDVDIINSGTIQVADNGNIATTITRTVDNTGTIRIDDASDTGGTTGDSHLNIQGAVTNSGTIRLEVTGGSHAANIDFSGGGLTNTSTGNLTIYAGNGAGNHTVTGKIINGGAIVVNETTTFNIGSDVDSLNQANGDFTISGGGTTTIAGSGGVFSNAGDIIVNTGQTLKIGANATLLHVVNAAYTGDGTLLIDDAGTMELHSNAGTNINLTVGTVGGAGGAIATNGGTYTLVLNGRELTLNSGVIENLNVMNVNGTIKVLDNGSTTTGIDEGIDNSSAIIIEDASDTGGATGHSQLNVGGLITNNSSGTITLSVTGGSHNAILNASGGITNDGVVTIGAGSKIIMNGTNFLNNSDLVVNGTLYMGNGIDDGGSDAFDDDTDGGDLTNSASGDITGSGIIQMEGGTFTNSGASTITPGNSPGRLVINGHAVFGAKTRLEMELAGTGPGQFDVLGVTGRFALGGTLAAVSFAGFAAAAGDKFDVVEWGARTGMFDEAEGLDAMPGVALDTTFGAEGLTLTAKTITAEGTGDSDVFAGTDGDDVVTARGGNDVLNGGLGDDLLLGGAGDDLLKGGDGSNRLIGGEGDDTADYSAAAAPVHVDLHNGSAVHATGADTLISIEALIGTNFADYLSGNAKDNVIVGGLGADTLAGGAGSDVFVLRGPGDAGDTITDFTSGQDVLELHASSFGFAPGTQVGNCFTVIGTAFEGLDAGANGAFAAGQAALIYSTVDHTLYYDSNGAGEGFVSLVTLQPGASLTASDIRLTDHLAA